MRASRRVGGEQGETLLELLVAITILGVSVVAIASGIALAVKTSGIHRSQASAGAYVRNYAEALEASVAGGGYVPCAGTASYPAYAPPAGYSATLSKVEYWTGATWSPSGCAVATDDHGLQRLTLVVSSSDSASLGHGASESLAVVVRKP